MTRNFNLDDKVWWFECNTNAGLSLREGIISGIRWRRAFLFSRKKIFWCGHDEVDIDLLYHSKEEAVAGMTECLQKLLA